MKKCSHGKLILTLFDLNKETIPPVSALTADVFVSINLSKFRDTPWTVKSSVKIKNLQETYSNLIKQGVTRLESITIDTSSSKVSAVRHMIIMRIIE
jgi:hypothetical protein